MTISRRDLLKLGAMVAAPRFVPSRRITAQAFATAGAADTKFLLVFLRGGYDAVNVIAPVASSFYYESRPSIALPQPDPTNPLAAVALEGADGWALHPALDGTIGSLWRRGQLAFVPFAGTDDLTRSHFETQDSVEGGLPVAGGAPRTSGSGFLNRLAAALGASAAPVAFTDGLPVAFSGRVSVPNVSLKGTAKPPFDDRQTDLLLSMYAGSRFEHLIAEAFALRQTVAEEAQMMASGAATGEMQAANRNAITASGFELEARRMATLMKTAFNIAFIDVGGWDTHVNQGNGQGQLANLLASLGQGLAGFAEQLGPVWNRTVVAVISEFGRTFRENGTRGTDHGHGSTYWVLGGAVHGRRLVGEQVTIDAAHLNQNRDFPVLNEYRRLLGGLFRRMYSLDGDRLDDVFPRAVPADLDLI